MYVFDLDGTLIDSTKRHHLLMAKLLKEAGQEIPCSFAKEYMDYKASGHSGRQYLEQRLHIPADLAADIQQRWTAEIENQDWLEFDKLYADAIPTLNFLRERNQRIMFLTMRQNKELLHNEIQRLGISEYPAEVVVLPPNGQICKGDVLKKVDKNIDFMIGDTENDYDAALQVCVKYYILHRGFRNREYWSYRGVMTYDSLVYILQLIDN